MAKRALVIQGGTMRGAYFVGVLKTFHYKLPTGYFDSIFSTSVGIFEQAFFASGQVYFMENTWREYVHGNQLINYLNFFRGKPIFDLDYLVNLFQSEKSQLDVEAMKNSPYNLYTFAVDCKTKEIVIMDLKKNNIFDLMRAACAIPFLYPKKVLINGRRCMDRSLSSLVEFRSFLKETLKDYDEVVEVTPNPRFNEIYNLGEIIKPSTMPLRSILDTNRERIIQTIQQGEIDAENFLNKKGII